MTLRWTWPDVLKRDLDIDLILHLDHDRDPDTLSLTLTLTSSRIGTRPRIGPRPQLWTRIPIWTPNLTLNLTLISTSTPTGRDSDLEADPDPNSDFDRGLNLHLNWPWRCSRPGLRLGIEISDRCEWHSHSDLSPDPNFESDSADPDPVFVLGLWPGCLVLYLQQSLFGLHQRDSMHEFQHVLVSSSITT